jgi:hypothetical protein
MTKKEIKEKEIKQAAFFRSLGYTFKSLVSHTIMQEKYTSELEQRLKLIDELEGKICLCSAMVNDQEVEGNTVPFLYCIIKDGNQAIGCPYVKASKEQINHALEIHKKLKEKNRKC